MPGGLGVSFFNSFGLNTFWRIPTSPSTIPPSDNVISWIFELFIFYTGKVCKTPVNHTKIRFHRFISLCLVQTPLRPTTIKFRKYMKSTIALNCLIPPNYLDVGKKGSLLWLIAIIPHFMIFLQHRPAELKNSTKK